MLTSAKLGIPHMRWKAPTSKNTIQKKSQGIPRKSSILDPQRREFWDGGSSYGLHSYGLYSYGRAPFCSFRMAAGLVLEMAYMVMAYIAKACIVMSYVDKADTVMAYILMAYIVMARLVLKLQDAGEARTYWLLHISYVILVMAY